MFCKTSTQAILHINNVKIEQKSCLVHLKVFINDRSVSKNEILSRIKQVQNTFTLIKNLFTNSDLNLYLSIQVLRSNIFPILLYSFKSWTFSLLLDRKLEVIKFVGRLHNSWFKSLCSTIVSWIVNLCKKTVF